MFARVVVAVALWCGFAGVSFGQDAGTVGMAAAYLSGCPTLRAGPRLVNSATYLYGLDKDASPDFRAGAEVQISQMRDMTMGDICAEGEKLFGRNGTVESGFLLAREAKAPDLADLVVAGDNRLPGDVDDVAVTSAYMFRVVQACPDLAVGSGFPFYLETMGTTIDDVSRRGDRVPRVMQAYQQIMRWREWQQTVSTGDADKVFCRVAYDRYGPDGTAAARLLKIK
ncbi:hypothetical protein [Rhizobium cremeum]|uniref:hypothetical protein n=1 Tax=Rhizobium cremeum TaxID=2813827 RepID=UPI0039E1AC1C